MLIFVGVCLLVSATVVVVIWIRRDHTIDTQVAEFARWLDTVSPSDFNRHGGSRV